MTQTTRKGVIVFLVLLAAVGGYGAYRHFTAEPTGTTTVSPSTPPAAPSAPAAPASQPAASATPASPAPSASSEGAPASAPASSAAAPAEQTTTVAQTTPSQPAAQQDNGKPSFDVIRVEPSGDATIAGRASPHAAIAIYANGAVVGRATANENGEWAIVLDRPLAPGEYELTVTSVADGGKSEVEAAERVAVSVPRNKTEQPLVAIVSPDQPTRVVQQPASAATPSVVITTIQLTDGTLSISGAAAPGALLKVYIDDAAVGDATAGAEGGFSLSLPANVAAGTHQVRVDQIEKSTGKVLARAEVPFDNEVSPAGQTSITAETPAAEKVEPTTVEVRRGDNLWRIAERVFGKGARYTAIYRANESQIRDPDLIYPGQILTIPR